MIDLDDTAWSAMHHAYGTAERIPAILASMHEGAAVDDPDFLGLFNCLIHQGSLYDASFAAFPHLVSTGVTDSPHSKVAFSIATVMLEALAEGVDMAPAMTPQIRLGFEAGLRMGRAHLASELGKPNRDANDELNLLCNIALFDLQPQVYLVLAALKHGFQCKKCGMRFDEPLNQLCPIPLDQ